VVLGFAALTAALMVACGVYLYQALRLELGARDRDEQRGKIVLFRQALAGVSDAGMLRRNPDWLTHFMVGHDGLALRVLDARAAVLVDSPAALPPGLWRGLDETPARLSGHDAHGHPWQGLAARATLADGQAGIVAAQAGRRFIQPAPQSGRQGGRAVHHHRCARIQHAQRQAIMPHQISAFFSFASFLI
jgi:hypothetical protein